MAPVSKYIDVDLDEGTLAGISQAVESDNQLVIEVKTLIEKKVVDKN